MILSQRSLRVSSVLFILFTLFCSSEVISTILSSSSLIHSSAPDFLLLIPSAAAAAAAKSLQSCLTLHDPMDCSPPGSSVHEISQARILELPFPSPGDLPGPGTEPASPVSPTLQTDSLPLSHWGSPRMQLGFPKEHRTFKCYICSDIKLTSLHLPISFHRTE